LPKYAIEIAAERRHRQVEIENLILVELPFDLDRAHDLPEFCVDGPLAARLHEPCELHGDGGPAGDDLAARDQLERRTRERQRIDAVMTSEALILIRQQQFEIGGIDVPFGVDRQPPAPVGHGIGA
jgi:hypothetical protein